MRCLAVACSSLALIACGAPTEPARSAPIHPPHVVRIVPFQPGPYLLSVVGLDLSNTPEMPVCAPIGVPPEGKAVHTHVDLRWEGDEWLGRGTSPGSSVIIHIRERHGVGSRSEMYGTFYGAAPDLGTLLVPPRGVTVTFGEAGTGAMIDGVGEYAVPLARGWARGIVGFHNDKAAVALCPGVMWMLQPANSPGF